MIFTGWVVLKLRRELCPHLKIILKMRRRAVVTTRKRPSSKVVSNLKRDKRTPDLPKKREVEEQVKICSSNIFPTFGCEFHVLISSSLEN